MKERMIRQELSFDSLTPMLVYKNLGGKGSCILESAYEKGHGKTSFIGIEPIGIFEVIGQQIEIELYGEKRKFVGDPYEALRQFSKDRRTFGFITYDAIRLKEAIPDRHPSKNVPDFFFRLYKTIITFYHDKQKVICTHEGTEEDLESILSRCFEPVRLLPFKTPKAIDFQSDVKKEKFIEMIVEAKKHIIAGDIFQVVLSRTLHAEVSASPFDIYRALRHVSPSPYHFLFEENDFAIVGASPELMISVQDGIIESMPIAGTCPKGQNPLELLTCPKESAEHVMLVDLARNDVGSLAMAGTVHVAEYMTVKSYSHVSHIVSRVTGQLAPSFHSLDAFKASFPAGTLSGAPKIRAMEIIDRLELSRRSLYGGAIVTLDEQGNLMSCIAIRTAFIRGSKVEIRVGAGIVLDSVAEKEVEETLHKARSVVEALELAEGM
ncbi:MAG: anthranilate synthase component I family protein [Parachlamydiaceae bacterium]|nr:anthranilate synthase component I family protein [Parachlamydiaceae bacterium]